MRTTINRAGENPITGTEAVDVLNGTALADLIRGLGEADSISGNDGDDLIYGGNGDDWAHGNPGNDWVFGENGHDSLYGGWGSDVVNGGYGLDWLDGGLGNDRLIGGPNSDYMIGGAGADHFVFVPQDVTVQDAWGNEVLDFVRAQGDRVDLRQIDAMAGGTNDVFRFIGTAAFSGNGGEVRYAHTGDGGTVVEIDIGNAVYGGGNGDLDIYFHGVINFVAGDFFL